MPRVQRIFILAGLLSLAASYLGIWLQFINDPVQRTGSDFIAFYSAGRVAQQEGYRQVYDPLLQQAVQEEQVGFSLAPGQVLLYNHLPYLVPLLQFLVDEGYVASFYRWVFVLIAVYLTAMLVLQRSIRDSGSNAQTIRLTVGGAFLFLPLFFSLMNGQDTAFLFAGAALWMYGLVTGRHTLAGLGLCLTTVRPHISLVLALPMLFRYRKVFGVYVLGSGILVLFCFLIVGEQGIRQYINILLVSAGGEWHGMKEDAMFNLIGLLTRAFPWLGAEVIRTAGWLVYGVSILGLILLWTNDKGDGKPIGPTILVALATVPHLHFHDLTLLLIPVFDMIHAGRLKGWLAAAAPIAMSLLLLLANSSYYLQYSIPYLIMLALGLYPHYMRQRPILIEPSQGRSPGK